MSSGGGILDLSGFLVTTLNKEPDNFLNAYNDPLAGKGLRTENFDIKEALFYAPEVLMVRHRPPKPIAVGSTPTWCALFTFTNSLIIFR